jgi:hypothetical protein
VKSRSDDKQNPPAPKPRFDSEAWKAELDRRSDGGGHTLVMPLNEDEPTRALPETIRPAEARDLPVYPEPGNRSRGWDRDLDERFREGHTMRLPLENAPEPHRSERVVLDGRAAEPGSRVPFREPRTLAIPLAESDLDEEAPTQRIHLDPAILDDSEAVTREIPRRPVRGGRR